MNKTVAIVGTHPETRSDAPFDDPRVDIWVFNEVANQKVLQEDGEFRKWAWRVDGVFQMHKPSIYRSLHNRSDPGHWEWLQKEHKFPIYLMETDPKVPSGVKYPLDEIVDNLLSEFKQGPEDKLCRYFTSTIAYAMALAIHEGYETILIYGVEMGSNTEYIYQRDCVSFWTGLALGRGQKVHFYSGVDIFDKPLYGYDGRIEQTPEEFAERIKVLEALATEYRAKRNEATEALHVSYKSDDLSDCISNAADTASQLGEIDGALGESERYFYKLTEMWDAEGSCYIDRNEFEGKAGAVKDELEENSKAVFRPVGLIEYLMKMWRESHNPVALNQLQLFIGQHINAAYKAGYSRGVWQENFELAKKWDKLVMAAGGDGAITALRGS